jgi:hypothetical protein
VTSNGPKWIGSFGLSAIVRFQTSLKGLTATIPPLRIIFAVGWRDTGQVVDLLF